MADKLSIYKCDLCGNIVELLHVGGGELVCCGQPMNLLELKTEDQGKEKHVPVVEKTGAGYLVKVGSVTHPMEDKHYIEWIDLVAGDKVMRKFLKPGDTPEAEFETKEENVFAREHCTVHGLWKS